MNQSMLLPVTFGGNQHGFAIFVLDLCELHAQIADEIGVIEDMADQVLLEFIHG